MKFNKKYSVRSDVGCYADIEGMTRPRVRELPGPPFNAALCRVTFTRRNAASNDSLNCSLPIEFLA
jgi:hypothetical protein